MEPWNHASECQLLLCESWCVSSNPVFKLTSLPGQLYWVPQIAYDAWQGSRSDRTNMTSFQFVGCICCIPHMFLLKRVDCRSGEVNLKSKTIVQLLYIILWWRLCCTVWLHFGMVFIIEFCFLFCISRNRSGTRWSPPSSPASLHPGDDHGFTTAVARILGITTAGWCFHSTCGVVLDLKLGICWSEDGVFTSTSQTENRDRDFEQSGTWLHLVSPHWSWS